MKLLPSWIRKSMSKKYRVQITPEALQDVFDIYRYISKNDSESIAKKIYEDIKTKCYELVNFPERGHVPSELEIISTIKYLEINFKVFRIFYYIEADFVFIVGIFDGRRNSTDILIKRLLK